MRTLCRWSPSRPRNRAAVPLLLFLLGIVGCRDGASVSQCAQSPSLVFVNGVVLTLDEAGTVASEFAVRDSRIASVNGAPPLDHSCAQIVDLEGRTVVPGLIDSHVHFVRQGLAPGHDVREAETAFSVAELTALMKIHAEMLPPDAILTVIGGIVSEQFVEGRLPTQVELDEVSSTHVVYVQVGFSGPAQTNSPGETWFRDHGVQVAADGSFAEGSDTEAAFAALRQDQTATERVEGTLALVRYANSVGLTAVVDEGGVPFPGAGFFDPSSDYDALLTLWRRGDLTVRVRAQFSTADETSDRGAVEDRLDQSWSGFGDHMLRVSGMGEHLVTFPRDGVVNDAYETKVRAVAGAGWSHEQHSTSDVENRQHLNAIEAAHSQSPIDDLRWSLTHVFELGHGSDLSIINRMRALGMGARVQNQGYGTRTIGFPLGRSLGGENRGPLFRTLFDAGIPLGGGTDGALLGPMNPWLSIYYMVTGRNAAGDLVNPEETLSRLEALQLYTMGSAWVTFEDEELGSIEVGKRADLVVLTDDYLSIPEDQIRNLRSVLTLVDGRVVYSSPPFGELLRN